MPEVPAHEHINACDRGHRNVLGVRQHPWPQHWLCKVVLGEFGRRWRQSQKLDVAIRHRSKHLADRRRRRFKLSERQFRKHETQIATHERLQQPARRNAEFVILTASDDRRVRIDPIRHVPIVLAGRAGRPWPDSGLPNGCGSPAAARHQDSPWSTAVFG